MPDRHFELPAHPNLEYYRKQAKHLQRTYAAEDAAARARAAEVLGDRAPERFLEYVRLLLGAGADPGTRTRGTTPLENAIYSNSTQVVDLLAEHGIVPQALWTYASCGRLDLVRACFDAAPTRPSATRSSKPTPKAGCTCSSPLAGTIP